MADDERTDVEHEDEVDQPGLRDLREAVANHLPDRMPSAGKLRDDAIAGLNGALASVPDGMATALLVGVNPILGLYACLAGPIAAGLLTSSALMVVATSSSSSLAAGQALASVPDAERANALYLTLFVVAVVLIGLGLLRLGRLTRFVSYSVMTAFIAGIAVLTVLSQLPTMTGYDPNGDNSVVQALDLATHLARVDVPTVIVAAAALAGAIALPLTPIGNLATLVAVVLPSVAVVLLGIGSIEQVRDVGEIPSGIPLPSLPDFSGMSIGVVTGGIAVGAIIMIQGAGVSQSVPNPDGTPVSTSRDFIAQGVGNAASALFGGTPVGGSLRTTALTVISGSRSRLAPIMVGVWMAVIVIVFPELVAYVAMPTLGAVLTVAAGSTIRPAQIISLLYTGWPSRIAAVTTFLATLFLPVQAAVGIGVALSAILYVYESAADISIVEVRQRPDGRIEEHNPDRKLRSNEVTVLDVYGTLFFAGARKFEDRLPDPEGSERPAVVIRLRGRTKVGATLIEVLDSYADAVAEAGGRLYLSGLGEQAREQLIRTEKLGIGDTVEIFEATDIRGESTRAAIDAARAWLENQP